MNKSTSLEEYPSRIKNKEVNKKKNKKLLINILIFLVSLGIWSGIVYYGYNYAKDYIDISIKNVQQENAMNIQELNEQIKVLTQEIKGLRNSLEDTDSTIASTSGVQKRIDEKLQNLDIQLKELQASLHILREAPDVQN